MLQVSKGVWGGGRDYSRGEGGEDTRVMEVKAPLLSAPEFLTCPNKKQRERMSELQERRRSLQAHLSTRLTELRRICLQEAELTGAMPSDFPLEAGEKPPCVRRRGGGTSHQGHGKGRVEEEDSQRSKLKKTLFSVSVRKHSDSENNNHGKRTVHRGCHTDDSVRSESSSMSDSTGHDYDDSGSQCRPRLVSAGSPVEVFYQNKTRNNRTEHLESLQNYKPLPHLISRSQDSSGPSNPRSSCNEGGNNSFNDLLDDKVPSEEGLGGHHGGLTVCPEKSATRGFLISETKRRVRISGEGGLGQGRGGFSEVLLDFVWGKPNQPVKKPITSQHLALYNGCTNQQLTAAPATYCPHGNQRRVTVTRTKSCGPFLSVQQNQTNTPLIQPDPHPHLLPPQPPQLPPYQDSQLEEATRSLHKALALEGLREWYLRNTLGPSHQNQTSGRVTAEASTKKTCRVKSQEQCRRSTHGIIKQSEMRQTGPYHKPELPHSATFHGHLLHDRSADGSFYQDSFPPQKPDVPLRDPPLDQPSPGTLV